jgi:steroid delta-isomerase-like uncharacterized protein
MSQLRKTPFARIALAITLFAATLSSAFTATSSVSAAENVNMLVPAANKVLVQSAVEDVMNGRNLSAADTLFADNFARYEASTPNVALGRKGMAFLTSYDRRAFSDLNYAVEDVIAEGDRVVTRWTATGTHQGFFGLYAPTGKEVTWSGVTIWQVRDGKILTIWVEQDTASQLQQLGGNAATSWGPAYYR